MRLAIKTSNLYWILSLSELLILHKNKNPCHHYLKLKIMQFQAFYFDICFTILSKLGMSTKGSLPITLSFIRKILRIRNGLLFHKAKIYLFRFKKLGIERASLILKNVYWITTDTFCLIPSLFLCLKRSMAVDTLDCC